MFYALRLRLEGRCAVGGAGHLGAGNGGGSGQARGRGLPPVHRMPPARDADKRPILGQGVILDSRLDFGVILFGFLYAYGPPALSRSLSGGRVRGISLFWGPFLSFFRAPLTFRMLIYRYGACIPRCAGFTSLGQDPCPVPPPPALPTSPLRDVPVIFGLDVARSLATTVTHGSHRLFNVSRSFA